MIINSICNNCLQAFSLMVQADEAELLRQIADENLMSCPCPRLCGGRINLVGGCLVEADGLKPPMSITGVELYKAVQGAGLPDELPKESSILDALLRANPITSCNWTETHDAVYLNEIHLNNGIVLHLTSGARGAQILKVTKERVV